jgi:anti-sigma-K factor RskA
MIPDDSDELHLLAGEYVLGALDPDAAREVETAFAGNEALRAAVAYWEDRLHPLSGLAAPVEPDPGNWREIAARITRDAKPSGRGWWNTVAPWRWSAVAAGIVAACLALYVALVPLPSSPSYVAMLRAPQGQQTVWIAVVGTGGLTLRAAASNEPPANRAYELWAIAPGTTRPEPLGVIAANGTLSLHALPSSVREGAILAISIEPQGGSPTGQPTGPVVFSGAVTRLL